MDGKKVPNGAARVISSLVVEPAVFERAAAAREIDSNKGRKGRVYENVFQNIPHGPLPRSHDQFV